MPVKSESMEFKGVSHAVAQRRNEYGLRCAVAPLRKKSLITHRNQGEPTRWSRYGLSWTNPGSKRFGDSVAVKFTAPNCHQRPRDRPHHVPQKPVRTDANLDQSAMRTFVSALAYFKLCDGANSVLNIRLRCRKRGPIVFTTEQLAGSFHTLEIERASVVMCVTPPERRYHWAIHDAINIRLLER